MAASASVDVAAPTSPPHPLPIETITMILQLLQSDFKTLAATALVNKTLCEESQRLLYRRVGFPSRERSPRADTHALAINPALARYVHEYILEHNRILVYPQSHYDPLCPGPALNAMVNLKRLDLQIFRGIPKDFLEGCPFQLESFSWIDCDCEWDDIYRFLRTQIKIRKLEFDSSHDVETVPPFPVQICHDLENLKSTPNIIEATLPGRRITTLGFVLIDVESERVFDFNHLSKELNQIKALSFLAPLEGPHLSTISKSLHCNLQYLEVFPLECNLLDMLPQFTSLIGLIFPTHYEIDDDLSHLQTPEETGSFFAQCSTLQFIDIQTNDDPIDKKFDRWLPGAERDAGRRFSEDFFHASDLEDHINY